MTDAERGAASESAARARLRSLCHLGYEAWMIRETARVVFEHWDRLDVITANAMIESHAIHARNLIYFLFDNREGVEMRARDFVPGWSETRSDYLGRAQGRVDDEIAHLSYRRLKVKNKRWDQQLDTEIQAVLGQWLERAPEDVRRIVQNYPGEECLALETAMPGS